ncbi:hypothetical protein [Deinococcus alpinitundrae]|uniref:hypothetical protein n=1 Tax=Deinococcus alpinitundrae TaxID=468913 RepID=UPI0013797A7C|nr:hypothetical protein [Deinococcus alpinitundrae]
MSGQRNTTHKREMKPDGELVFQHTEDGLTIRVRVEVTYHRDNPSENLSAEFGTAPLGFLSPQLKASVNSYFQACKAERQARATERGAKKEALKSSGCTSQE